MNPNKRTCSLWRWLILAAGVSLLAACAAPSVPTEEVQATVTLEIAPTNTAGALETDTPGLPETGATPTPAGTPQEAYVTLEPEACQQLAEDLQAALGVEDTAVSVEENAVFEEDVTGETGTGCQVTVTATGADFPEAASFADVVNALQVVFQSIGYDIDPAFAADAPLGTRFGLRRNGELVLFRVEAEPAEGADCPEGQPIDECELDPEQINYTIQVNAAREGQ